MRMKLFEWVKNRWARRVVGSVVVLMLGILVAWLAVPPLVKWQLEKQATAQLGRQVTVGRVQFSPFSLELSLHQLQIASADGTFSQLAVQRVYVNAAAQSLLKLAPVLDALQIDQPRLQVTHLGGGRYDVDDILARFKAAPPAQPEGEPHKFALYNLRLTDGAVALADRSVGKTHTVADLQLSLPFLSNLPSQRLVTVLPRLAFKLGAGTGAGSSFDSAAQATPFTDNRKTDATLRFDALDLQPYLAYLPPDLPARLRAATLSADLKVAFEEAPQAAVKVSGTVQLGSVSVAALDGSDLAGFSRLTVGLADVQPLARQVTLSTVSLEQPQLAVRRDKAGRLNLDLAAAPSAALTSATKKIAASADSTRAGDLKALKTTESRAWNLSLGKFELTGGRVSLSDDSVAAPVRLALQSVALQAQTVTWPVAQPVDFSGTAQLAHEAPTEVSKGGKKQPSQASTPGAAEISFSGSATDQAAQLTTTVGNLPLAWAGPYLAAYLKPAISGSLRAQVGVQWAAGGTAPGTSAGSPTLTLSLVQLSLDKLALADSATAQAGSATWPSLRLLQLSDAQIDVTRQRVSLGRLALVQPALQVQRGADGRWMYERWLPETRAASATATQATTPQVAAPSSRPTANTEPPAWRVTLGELIVQNGSVGWRDAAASSPVALELSALQLQLKAFALPLPGTPTNDLARPSAFSASARLVPAGASLLAGDAGQISFKGSLASTPLNLQGEVLAQRLPVHAA